MNKSEKFKVSGPNIVHEVIEGEVVIVNMNNGYYFSSEKLGSVIWRLLEGGISFDGIVAALATRYPENREAIETSAAHMIGELLEEGLIIAVDDVAGNAFPEDPFDGVDTGEFVAPVLHKHKDMKDLLLVDPIHEVEASGWPHTPGR